ncbi:MAG: LppA family lipoprotein [Pseudonocardiales bacterium]
MSPASNHHRRRLPATLVALAVLLSGCGIIGGESVEDQRAALRQRPDINAISARYEQMQTEVRDRLSAEIGGLNWMNHSKESHGGCGFEFPDVREGKSRSLPGWSARGGIPDERWDQAVAIVQEITGQYGFSTPKVVVNRPGDHKIVVPDPYGGTLDFGTAVNTILHMHTGCHLPPQ